MITAGKSFWETHFGAGRRKAELDCSIADLELSVRTTNCLESQHIYTIGDLIGRTPYQLLCISKFGLTNLDEVVESLYKIGLELR